MKTWYLYDQKNEKKYDNLSPEACRSVLSEVSTDQAQEWICWTQGESNWRCVLEISELKAYLGCAPDAAPLPAPEEDGGAERRKFPRFDIKLRVIITNKKSTFLTTCKDVSVGGMLLAHTIPDKIFTNDEEVDVFISAPQGKESIQFRCIPRGDLQNKKRIEFIHKDTARMRTLATWINECIKPFAKLAG
jgi:hypothetical protein